MRLRLEQYTAQQVSEVLYSGGLALYCCCGAQRVPSCGDQPSDQEQGWTMHRKGALTELAGENNSVSVETYLNINYICMHRRVNCGILYMNRRSVEIIALYSMCALAMQVRHPNPCWLLGMLFYSIL